MVIKKEAVMLQSLMSCSLTLRLEISVPPLPPLRRWTLWTLAGERAGCSSSQQQQQQQWWVMVMSLWRQAPCLRQWTVLVDASTGEGSPLALPISAADGLETWPLSAEEHPFHRGPTPISVPVIKPQSAARPGVSRGLAGPATWVGGWRQQHVSFYSI